MLVLVAAACSQQPLPLAAANTAVTPATHLKFPIASGVHALSCDSCHGTFSSFQQFTCLDCHAHDRPIVDELHRSVDPGYAYASASCLSCHPTGARVAFDHRGVTSACATCHDVGTPFDALPIAGRGLDGGSFVHPDKGGHDCGACHVIATWLNARGAQGAPDGVRDPSQDIVVAAQVPSYAGTSIAALLPLEETLPMPMFHGSPAAASVDCATCHPTARTGTLFPGRFHASVTTQPAACVECHAGSAPVGFVGPVDGARAPASGAMKHDAVVWSSGARTATPAAPQECALCHQTSSWATSQKFHASLGAQPVSCLDCHANSRPALLTSANASLPAGVQFDHSTDAALGECAGCHAGSFTSWSGGRFHLASGATTSSCLPCHERERPDSTIGWVGSTWRSAPFDYASHGAALDCATCHSGPGTGSWGGAQNWAGGSFAHAPSSLAGGTCIACHATQRPDLVLGQDRAASLLPGNFDHALKGTADCFSCHRSTTSYASYFNGADSLPGGDWAGGIGDPDGVRDPSEDVAVLAEVPIYAGTSIASVTAQSEILPMPMFHSSATVPPSTSCGACHAGAASGRFFPGRLHASLASQPAICLDCHAGSAPFGFVGPIDAKRSPASGAMKHDAVVWSNGTRTATPAAPRECALCHLAPPGAIGWTTSLKFHASIPAPPGSCLDCHANSRPALLTSANAALPAGMQFDHATATGECSTCHAGSFAAWTGGKFHLAGSATPSTCATCHQGERPTSTAGWVSGTWRTGPFDFASHGAGLDCATCHNGPGTGAWGGTQNWAGGNFSHSPSSLAASTCISCHATQRPDLVLGQAQAASLLPGNFDHAVKGTADCFSCHQGASTSATYFSPSGTLPGGGWAGGIGDADGVRDPARDIVVLADVPTYAGTSIASVTPRREALPMPMFHSSATVPASMSCSGCHAGAASGNFSPGRLHASLPTQPATCIDCHASSAPAGFVGPVDSSRSPQTGAMKHDAVLWSGSARTPTLLVPQECSLCHEPSRWATSQKFHASILAQPVSCLDCHANSRPALLTSANAALPGGVQFDHATALGECATCHVGSFSSWTGGKFHLGGGGTPSTCLPCHQGERPTSTAGWRSAAYPDFPFDYATHGAAQDCATCHAGPGTGSWGATQDWVGGVFAHAPSSLAGSTCLACHATQRPDLVLGQAQAASLLPGNFDHAVKGTADCFSCHQGANASVAYFDGSGRLPGGGWAGGIGDSDGVRDPTQDIVVLARVPTYSGTSIASVTAQTETLPMPMSHSSGSVPQSISCGACHEGAATGVFLPGRLHASLATQPAACLDCHAASAPVGFVGSIDAKRSPATGAMKHDAVLWSNGARTSAPAAPQECALCHLAPPAAIGWTTSLKFHASVGAQPASCLDCHANSRPAALLTSANAALPAGVQFDHSTAPGECATCHAGSFSAWSGGKFHLAGSATPSSCMACHQGERPGSTAGWISNAWRSAPFDFATHGAGQDCALCHTGPGSGSWGGTQNWAGGNFTHASASLAASTCLACHATQRPDLVLGEAQAAGLLPGNFDHAIQGTADCFSCHQATVAANAFASYFNGAGTLPGGDWTGGIGAPDDVRDPSQDRVVSAAIPSYSGTSIASVTAQTETLPMPMFHSSAGVPASTSCSTCHAGAASGNFSSGRLHASLATQPATCIDCHAASAPAGFVGSVDARRSPQTGEMKHDAVVWSNGARTATPAAPQECSLCHLAPPAAPGWATSRKLHASIATQPASCLDCHANSRPAALLTSANAALPAGAQFDHSTALGECATCHAGSFSAWAGGKFHLAGSATPSSCATCHRGERPTSTAGWIGSTWRTAPFDFFTHGAGLDCATCHDGPGTGAWGGTQSWAGGNFNHTASPLAASTCIGCHATQRPDLVLGEAQAASLLPGNFDHAVQGTADCLSCHRATVAANTFANYFNGAGTLPGGNWTGGIGDPDGTRDPSRDVIVAALVPTYVSTSITALAARAESLPMPMFHSSAALPQPIACSSCHAGAGAGVFFPGLLHASLTALGIAQPATCGDCHATSAPVGFVGPIDTARTPASGAMKHDAVVWNDGARTATPAAPQECSLCHLAPPASPGWATTRKLHASIAAQPASCLDCHANSRPALLTSANAALPTGVQFDHSTATGECTSCHASGSFTSWTGGRFHLAGSASPSSCLPCHQGERPSSTAGWRSATYASFPFDYTTHGAALDCAGCHVGPGTGSWGGNQNWVGGAFAHTPASLAGATCLACHSTQRPDLVLGGPVAAALLPGRFDHAVKGTADCFSCHRNATPSAAYFNASGTLPGGGWGGGIGDPDGVRDPAQDVVVVAEVPVYAGTSIVSVTAVPEALPMPMSHSSTTVPQSTSCSACHAGAAAGTFVPGRLHAALPTQPATCLDCHATSAPTGFVGPFDAKRSPASGGMKHDAVVWIDGTRTATLVAPQECALCHLAPPIAIGWSTSLKFHTSVGAQPASCLDCHANSRPALLTSANAALPAGVQFDHSTAPGECATCHAGSFSAWAGGKFHLAGNATPSSCATCHQGERPSSTAGWVSNAWRTAPFDFTTHGAALDCATCHTGPGTGSWGGTQNWVSGNFNHTASPLAASTCIVCHATQRPDLVLGQAQAANLLPSNFDHAVKGTADCFSCHHATVAANAFVKYFNSAGTLPGGDWGGGIGTPDNVRDPSSDVVLTASIPSYSGTSIASVTAQAETLPMPMFHSSAAVPASTPCSTCHAGAASGNFSSGRLHASLTTQPATCTDCHAASAPAGFVGPVDPRRSPATGEMKHDAVVWSGGARTTTPAAPQECALCHQTSRWATSQKFHASIAAQPSSCLDCHANSRPALLTSANAALPAGLQFDHSTALGECATCHAGPFSAWTGGRFHLPAGATPSSCLPCHQGERPTSTAGWVSNAFRTAPFDFATHGAAQDCATCHGGPGTGSWGGTQNWVGGNFNHAASPIAASSCLACHGTQRPDLVLGQALAAILLPGNFDHAVKGTADCFSCHQATFAANTFANYFNAVGTLPGGGWAGGIGDPDGVRDPAQDIVVLAEVPTYAGTSIASVTARSEALPMAMFHSSATVPQDIACSSCHARASTGTFFPGRLHASLTALAIAQPATCADCHATSAPVGFVGPIDPARTPASGAMKHDAVLWSNGSPTATLAAPQECAPCHLSPPASTGWATSRKFHASIAAQPASCLDCHANSRPVALMTSANAALPAGVQFDHSAATGECATCHGTGAFSAWTGGKFHLTGGATPSSCATCHEGERPTSTAGWRSATYPDFPFDYATHGAAQDCATCHAGPGTGSWGGTQNWVGGSFAHEPSSLAGATCLGCHATQRPDLVLGETAAAALLPGRFDHAVKGTVDCFSCHQGATPSVAYFNPSGTLPGGGWAGGVGDSDGVRDPAQDVVVLAEVPTYAGTSIASVTAQNETLPMPMFHSSATVPASMSCSACHAGAASGVFFPGRLHASVTTQPATCLDCHATSAPFGFVGSIDAKRSPATGTMKHDAVVWTNGTRTATPAAPRECAQCHLAPSVAIGWATSLRFHASVVAQPASCLDCHANSRPTALLTSANAALPPGMQFDHSTAPGDCTTCHAGSFSAWTGGKFHLAGSATPSSCLTCHQGERPDSTAGWISNTWRAAPFDFATHGAGLDCAACHPGPGTGSWGGTQNWAGGNFTHSASSPAASTCIACHATERPDLVLGQAQAASLLPANFDHAVKGTADCFSCHRPTTSYARYFNATGSLPGGDWSGGTGDPDNVRDVSQDIVVTAAIPSYSGTSIASVTAENETLPMPMFHSSAAVPASMSCGACHAGAPAGNFFPGRLHASLATQPATCVDCHAASAPAGFVGPVDARRSPATGEMKHDAVLWSNGTRTATPAAPQECALCHLSPLASPGWATSRKFHASVPTQPASCLDCHANSRPGLLTSANAALPAGVQFDHSTATAECTTCHASGSFSAWTGGKFHLSGSGTPSTCAACHQGERPTSTAGWTDGSYRISPFDFATHGTGLDCATCHDGPGTGSWGGTQNWAGGRFSHGPSSLATSTCVACHATQRPDLVLGQAQAANLLPGNFDHALKGTADCFSCHQATVAANAFVAYFNAAGTLPGGDWAGGVGAPDNVRNPSLDVAVTALVPTYASTSITALTAQAESLPMPMFHSSATLPAAISCSSCHAGASAGVFFPARLHSSLTALALAQPGTCVDCHASSAPVGFVGPTDSVRTPPSPAMKHDAVLWSGGARTTTPAVPQECSLCHQPPGWVTSQKFHASIPAQPSSCLDCHANSRPALLTSANAGLPAGVQLDHAAAAVLGECASCHRGSFTSWIGGRFHLPGGATPSTCLPCHQGERPTSTVAWIDATYRNSPFDYVTNAAGVTHGAGQDCVTCHAGPGTGSWGGTQNWAGGNFAHAMSLVAGSTCIACHSTQRPDLVLGEVAAATLLPGNFDHALQGTGDCRGCHAATIAANAYVRYFNGSGTLPGGDWSGGLSYPGSTLVSAPGQVITVPELILTRSQTGLVTGTSAIVATLYDGMLHVSAALPPALNAGPAGNPDPSKCWHCHTNTDGAVTSYTNGLYHASLDNYRTTPGAPVTPLPQPAAYCSDCHAQTRPAGIVEWAGSELLPMDHDAAFTSGSSANQIDCSSCHGHPGSTWADGAFHARVAPAVPQDCTVCHYPLMADGMISDVTSGVSYTMSHQSTQLGFQNCRVCHVSALVNATAAPVDSALWRPGTFHANVAPQPSACNDCHAVSIPATSTQSTVSYALSAGATASNERQWMSHWSSWVLGKDCVTCHAADAAPGVTAWNNSDSFHAAVTGVSSCAECHGLSEGDNVPQGLTSSSVVSSAAGDGTSGVPAGTHDQITHADLNVILHDCNFCHSQAGASNAPGVQGKEWAQASFHASFGPGRPLLIDGIDGRCSNCHLNVRPPAGFTVEDHSGLSAAPETQDCSSCHSWPGTGTPSAPNWLGGAGFPELLSVGGFTVPAPPAPAPVLEGAVANLPHPTETAACTDCHSSESGGKPAIGYDHASLVGRTSCNACHEAGSNLVGTAWNGATTEALGAGDTRPFTLPSVYAAYLGSSRIVTWPNHFYSSGTRTVDCHECHRVPPLYGATTTGSAYLRIGTGGQSSSGAWAFPHNQAAMTNPDTCAMCHGSNIPR